VNEYVECTLKYVLAFLSHSGARPWSNGAIGKLHIALQADNDFYSQTSQLKARGLPATAEALSSLPPFLPCPIGTQFQLLAQYQNLQHDWTALVTVCIRT
jgi:hypothetical protein